VNKILSTVAVDEVSESPATVLCKSCGLCCTGHLFSWAKLKSVELTHAQNLGLNVFGSEPHQRGFSQPCPLWEGQCIVYASPHYPHACHTYKCKLLKQVLDESIPLPDALTLVQQAKGKINQLDALLPKSPSVSFRERLVTQIEHLNEAVEQSNSDLDFLLKAKELLSFYKKYFGVKDLIDKPDEE